MKQIELLHASRSRFTEISLLPNDAVSISVLHPDVEPQVSATNVCKLAGGLQKAYLIVLLKLFKHFHTFPSMDIEPKEPTSMPIF